MAFILAAILAAACSNGGDKGGGKEDAGRGDALGPDASDGRGDPAGKPDVGDAGIADAICTPGEVAGCSGPQYVEKCSEDGAKWELRPCPEGQACKERGLCEAVVCMPDQTLCEGDKVYRCDREGQAKELVADCGLETTGRTCFGGTCMPLCEAAEKGGTNQGCQFWAVQLDNAFVCARMQDGMCTEYIDANSQQFSVVVSNPSALDAHVKAGDHNGVVEEALVAPETLYIFNLPKKVADGTVLSKLAWHIESDVPIVAYQFNPLDNTVRVYSNDASLLLPMSALGTEYFVMTRRQEFDELKGYVTVVGVRPEGTQVTVKVTAKTRGGMDDYGGRIPPLAPGETITRTLQQFEVLNIETGEVGADLTGSEVTADRPVAVFGGSEAADAPNRDNPPDPMSEERLCCADHLEDQMFPNPTLGGEFVCAKSFDRGAENDVWRILAVEDQTAVDRIGSNGRRQALVTLNKGEYFEWETREDFELISSGPLMVAQFLAAEEAGGPDCRSICNPETSPCRCDVDQSPECMTSCDPDLEENCVCAMIGDERICRPEGCIYCRPPYCIGDPAMILIAPMEQFRKSYIFLAPVMYEFDYVTIVAPTGAQVDFDNEPVSAETFEPVGRGAYSAARFKIQDGVHSVKSDVPIGITVYGYSQYVSYGYAGGLNLLEIHRR